MQINKNYRHKNFRDVYIHVLNKKDEQTYEIAWFNLGFTGKPWLIYLDKNKYSQEITIENNKLDEWEELTEEQIKELSLFKTR